MGVSRFYMKTYPIVFALLSGCLFAQDRAVRDLSFEVDVRTYNFAPQVPGGVLSTGKNTITLAPCPAGVSGSDSLHYLYVSGGTGNPEAVLIGGGTCTGIAGNSGTLVFTVAGPHSGAWRIQSATAGVQEAYNANGGAGRFRLPAAGSPYYFDAPVSASTAGGASLFFEGDGYPSGIVTKGTTILNRGSGNLFNIAGDAASGEIAFEKMALLGTASSGSAIRCTDCGGLRIREVLQNYSSSDGLICSNCTGARIENSFFMGNGGNGATFSAVADAIDIEHSFFYSNCTTASGPCYGLVVYNGIGVVVHASDFEGTGGSRPPMVATRGFGAGFNSVFSLSFTGNYCERNLTQCLYLGNNVEGFDVSGNYMEESGVLVDGTAAKGSIHGNYFTNVLNTPKNVSAASANAHGFCEITTSVPHLLTVGSFVYLRDIGGATSCNGSGILTGVRTPTTFEVSLPFSAGTYTKGGTAMQVSGIKADSGKDVVIAANDLSQTGTFIAGADLMNGVGRPIASAPTIAPTNRVHHITGTSVISNIAVISSQPSGFAGTFCAIPDGVFTTTTTGNIALASKAAIGRQLCWTYDPSTLKWYPSY